MYFIERYLGKLKSYVRNKARPEVPYLKEHATDLKRNKRKRLTPKNIEDMQNEQFPNWFRDHILQLENQREIVGGFSSPTKLYPLSSSLCTAPPLRPKPGTNLKVRHHGDLLASRSACPHLSQSVLAAILCTYASPPTNNPEQASSPTAAEGHAVTPRARWPCAAALVRFCLPSAYVYTAPRSPRPCRHAPASPPPFLVPTRFTA
ncbi:hypothetical protein DAI22_08g130548 [Oryza sativa Japonica Group]|nr:hypothetical protein DAI22_08g130548 [Oryza sativa Japonica Group]